MAFFQQLKSIIDTPTIAEKWEQFQRLKLEGAELEEPSPVEEWKRPSYLAFCRVVPPNKLPRRRWGGREKRGALLHALLHIESSAIDLALDSAYRFRGMPEEFYRDWLKTAEEEFRHYFLIEGLLEELGYKYGDFPVHTSLFEAAQRASDLLSRMAIIPRWYEANGLDANRRLISKIEKFPDRFSQRVVEGLKLILKEEIPHVARGDRWFKWECRRRGLEPVETYFQIVDRFFERWQKRDLNLEARLKAGFSCPELRRLSGDPRVC
ncbi:MAG: ferritin-like domain-containing protein [Campylobacterales bacterium]